LTLKSNIGTLAIQLFLVFVGSNVVSSNFITGTGGEDTFIYKYYHRGLCYIIHNELVLDPTGEVFLNIIVLPI